MKNFKNLVCVLTGAASGIGRSLTVALAREGAHLALVDVQAEGLASLARDLESTGVRISTHVLNVSDRAAMENLPAAVIVAHGSVQVLINNAGVSLAAPVRDQSLDDFEWLFGVNFFGAVYACHAFLPHLLREEQAHIVNILSDFALTGFPGKSAYSSSKFALRGFCDSLYCELAGTRVGLTAVYPGPVATDLVSGGRASDPNKQALEAALLASGQAPDAVARQILTAVRKKRYRVRLGKETFVIDWITRLLPSAYYRLLRRFQHRIPFV